MAARENDVEEHAFQDRRVSTTAIRPDMPQIALRCGHPDMRTVCLLTAHKWNKVPYPGNEDQGFFLRCVRRGHENHDVTTMGPRGPVSSW